MAEENENAVTEPETTAPETEDTTPAAPETSTTDTQTQDLKDDKVEALVYPDGSDAEAVLKFRKACGYPDDASGYGLPMGTDEERNLANFLHRCQLDGIAAKSVADNLKAQIAAEEKAANEKFTADVNKVKESWGEKSKVNESLVKRGAELMKIDVDALKGISETIGVEAALNMMMLLGKTNADYSGVSGNSGGVDENVEGFIARKRATRS